MNQSAKFDNFTVHHNLNTQYEYDTQQKILTYLIEVELIQLQFLAFLQLFDNLAL